MKMKLFTVAIPLLLLWCLLPGCQTGKVNSFDRLSGTIVTQQVEVVRQFTNTFQVTNMQSVTSFVPYIVKEPVYVTQSVAGATTVITQLIDHAAIQTVVSEAINVSMSNSVSRITSSIPVPQIVPNPTKDAIVGSGAGMAGNLVGLGGIASIIALSLLHGYQSVRNKQLLDAATGESATKDAIIDSTIQGIETIREVLKTTPQGAKLDSAVKGFLVQHQAAAGIIQQVADLASKADNPAAKQAASLIIDVAGVVQPPPANTAAAIAASQRT